MPGSAEKGNFEREYGRKKEKKPMLVNIRDTGAVGDGVIEY